MSQNDNGMHFRVFSTNIFVLAAVAMYTASQLMETDALAVSIANWQVVFRFESLLVPEWNLNKKALWSVC